MGKKNKSKRAKSGKKTSRKSEPQLSCDGINEGSETTQGIDSQKAKSIFGLGQEELMEVQKRNGEVLFREVGAMVRSLVEIERNAKFSPFPFDMEWLGGGIYSAKRDYCSDDRIMLTKMMMEAFTNIGSRFPTFSSLERPSFLSSRCRHVFDGEKEKGDLVAEIWSGRKMSFLFTSGRPHPAFGDLMMIEVFHDDQQVAELVLSSVGGVITMDQSKNAFELKSNQRLLVGRILHVFLRSFAFLLPSSIIRRILPEFEDLASNYMSKKYLEDYLDWNILRADLILNLPDIGESGISCVDVYKAFRDVSLSLQQLGKFDECGRMWEELMDSHKGEDCLTLCLYKNAAPCFEASGDYDALFRVAVKALQFCETGLSRRLYDHEEYQRITCEILRYLIIAFQARFEKLCATFYQQNAGLDELHSREAKRAIGCFALLTTHQPVYSSWKGLFALKGSLHSAMKSELCDRQVATKVMIQLFRTGSTVEYEKKFAEVITSDVSFDEEQIKHLCFFEENRSSMASIMKSHARDKVKNRFPTFCSLCSKPVKIKDAMYCSCEKVKYCNQECQSKHWKVHKKACSHRTKKDRPQQNET